MRSRRSVGILAALLTLACTARLEAAAPVYHGALFVRPAAGSFTDKTHGVASLRVKNWTLSLYPTSNGIEPADEPVQIAVGDADTFVIPAGGLTATPNGKRFSYRNPTTPRGIRSIAIKKLKDDNDGTHRYRIDFSVAGVELSSLTTSWPICVPLAVIVGDDDGFTGVWLNRPGAGNGKGIRLQKPCDSATDWPWA